MTIQEFRTLNFEQRVEYVSRKEFIDKRESPLYTVFLYEEEGFFIEAFRHKVFLYIYAVEAVEIGKIIG